MPAFGAANVGAAEVEKCKNNSASHRRVEKIITAATSIATKARTAQKKTNAKTKVQALTLGAAKVGAAEAKTKCKNKCVSHRRVESKEINFNGFGDNISRV